MARATRDSRLENRTNRLKLPLGEYLFAHLSPGLQLVYRRPRTGAGSWYVRMQSDGVGSRTKFGTADDYEDADGSRILSFHQAQERCRRFAAESRKTALPKLATMADAVDNYVAWFRDHRKSIATTLSSINAHILPALGRKRLVELTTQDLRKWHESISAAPARRRCRRGSPDPSFRPEPSSNDQKRARKATANRQLAVLKAILNRAWQDGLVADDAAWRKVKPFSRVDEPVIRFLTTQESARLINACSPDFRVLVQAALLTGCRYGELARLRVADISANGSLRISAEAKSGRTRHVFLSEDGALLFASLTLGKVGSDHVFLRADGKPWGKNHQSRPIQDACEAARIDPAVTFHDLRHTYASMLAQQGVDLLSIAKLLGHADTRITARHYAHLCDDTLRNAVARLPKLEVTTDRRVVGIN